MNTFTKNVTVPQRDAAGKIMEADGKPVVAKDLGTFTFRHASSTNRKDIAVQINRDLCEFPSFDHVWPAVYYQVAVAAHFPRLVETAPDGWDWDVMTEEEGRVLLDTYLEEVRKNGSQGV